MTSRRFVPQWVLRIVALVCVVFPLAAQSSYVMAVKPTASVSSLAAKYHLSIVKTWQTSVNSLISAVSTAPLAATDLFQLRSEPGVVAVDLDSPTSSPETDPSSTSRGDLTSVSDLINNHQTWMGYYGGEVWSSYLNQASANLIESGAAITSFGAGSGIVAVIDTGVDVSHKGLRGALIPGYDFTRNRPDTVSELFDVSAEIASVLQQSTVEILDSSQFVPILAQSTVEILDQSTVEILDGQGFPGDFGHGTMVAGLIHLVAPQAKIMPLKAFSADGTAQLVDVVSAIYYAVDHGADVINMSFGYTTPSTVLANAIAYAQSHGVIMVASSGNQGRQTSVFPAGYGLVEGVGSTNLADQRSSFSNWGQTTDTSAPGEALITFFPGNHFAAAWGTSFSTALVSGAAALMVGIDPMLTPLSFQAALKQGVPVDLGMGHARLDLVPSLTYLLQHP